MRLEVQKSPRALPLPADTLSALCGSHPDEPALADDDIKSMPGAVWHALAAASRRDSGDPVTAEKVGEAAARRGDDDAVLGAQGVGLSSERWFWSC